MYRGRVIDRRLAWGIVLVATLTMSVSYVDRTALSVLAPSVTKEMGISDFAYGWLSSAFHMAYLFGTPLAGMWIDRVGARRGLTVSVLSWSLVAAMHSLAPGFGVLFGLRIALGITEGPSFPGAAQTVQRVLAPQERSRGFGVLFTGSSVGAMIAPPLAGALYGVAGWRFAFVGTAAVGLLWVPLWVLLTRAPVVREAMDLAPPPQASTPVRTLDIASHPIMVRALVAILATAPISGFVLQWGAKLLVRRYGLGQAAVGAYLWLPPLAFDAGSLFFGDQSVRQRRAPGAPPRTLFAISAVLASTMGLLPFAATPWSAMGVCGLAMAGVAGTYALVTSDMLGRMPPERSSSAAGIIAGAQSMALIISGPIIGRAVDRFGTYDVVGFALGAWALPGNLVWWLWRPAERFASRSASTA